MQNWVRPHPGRRGYRLDALSALGLAIGAGLSAGLYSRLGIYENPAPVWVSVLAVAGCTLPLALRRRYPIPVAIVVSLAFFIVGQFHVPEALFASICLFIAIYTVGAWTPNRRAAIVSRSLIVAAMFAWVAINITVTVNDPDVMPGFSRSGLFSQLAAFAVINVLTNLLYFVGAWVFGNGMWASARQRAQLEAQAVELAAEREFSAAQAVALDRVRIARELHDVVAHHVSVVGVQAGAARRVLSADPAQASESLTTIEQSARSAVDELHGLLTTLRDGSAESGIGSSASSSSSTRGVSQLPELVHSAGIPARLHIVGEARPLSSLIGFTIYRVAQESLTNARKHAGPDATVDVRLRYDSSVVELEVADTGGHRRAHTGGGLGQLGMRERIDAVGGSIEFGARARGGYLVRASIPVETP